MPEAPQFKRALVIKLRHHGDVLLTTPVFSTLAAHGIEADALIYDETAEMLSLNPRIAQIHCVGRGWRHLAPFSRLARYWTLVRELKRRDYDLIVHLTSHWHGAWLARLLEPRVSVAPRFTRNGFWANRAWTRAFTSHYPVLTGNRRHTVETHLDALRRIGIQPEPAGKALSFVSGADAEDTLRQKLAARGVEHGTYVLIHPTSRWQFKTWPGAHMAELIDALTGRGDTVVLSGAPTDAELAWVRAMKALLARPVVDLAGQLSLKELGALIGGARAFVGVDSVPMHLAAALGTPTVALFGPSGDVEWGPWQVPHRVVTADFRCRPCGNDGCGGGKISDCLTAITVSRVLQALDDLLQASRR